MEQTKSATETVSKADFDAVVQENVKLKAAFNKALSIIANTYAENVAQTILADVNKTLAK